MNHRLGAAALLALALPFGAQAAVISAFAEDFEGDLSAWTDRNPGDPDAAIVADPLRAGNHVLGFNRTQSAGSIFTTDFITTTGDFTVSFEYLGLPRPGSVPGNFGGFFGISQAFPGTHFWVAGTGSFPAPIELIDDGTWHSYTLTFSSPIGQTVHLMFEDFSGSGGVSGDVFFDNVVFNDSSVPPAPLPNVPEPGTLLLLAAAPLLGGVACRRVARRR